MFGENYNKIFIFIVDVVYLFVLAIFFLSVITVGFLDVGSLYSPLSSAYIPLFLMKTRHLTRAPLRTVGTCWPKQFKVLTNNCSGATFLLWPGVTQPRLEVFLSHRANEHSVLIQWFLNFVQFSGDLPCLDFQEEVVKIDRVMEDL